MFLSTTMRVAWVLSIALLWAPASAAPSWFVPLDAQGVTMTSAGSHACVLDTGTQLIWSSEVLPASWVSANTVAANYSRCGHHMAWRVPTRRELTDLYRGTVNYQIDETFFPQPSVRKYWSNDESNSLMAWALEAKASGGMRETFKTLSLPVRLVRSKQMPEISGLVVTPERGGASANVQVTSDRDGRGYWEVWPATTGAPSSGALMQSGQRMVLNEKQDEVFSVTGLQPGTAYALYFSATASGSFLPTPVMTLRFTTPNLLGAARPSVAPVPVPAVSPWGLGVLSLGLIFAGWISVHRTASSERKQSRPTLP
ncbi:DUF1566 domain-containing protein [Ottowia thiooxydans]|uniref:Lcl C-terminal domain-containing protein n=1 Tax=Ottowia thiooxydans TaxID=219182 RepID=UPI00048EFF2B|nr:DUF1566 domain-containing protein [Ottowia thiooxydans]